jgi:hypothetical protein
VYAATVSWNGMDWRKGVRTDAQDQCCKASVHLIMSHREALRKARFVDQREERMKVSQVDGQDLRHG